MHRDRMQDGGGWGQAWGMRLALFSPRLAAGALRTLAVPSAGRYAALPDTPTVGDLGVSGVAADTWWGMLAPAKTPREIISRLHGLMTMALEEPAVKQSLSEQGLIYRLSSPEEFGAFLASEIARWAKVIKENKIAVAY